MSINSGVDLYGFYVVGLSKIENEGNMSVTTLIKHVTKADEDDNRMAHHVNADRPYGGIGFGQPFYIVDPPFYEVDPKTRAATSRLQKFVLKKQ